MIKITGAQLRTLRELAELTQAQMGKATGFERSHIANMEKGRREIPANLDLLTVKSKIVVHILAIRTEIENWRC